MTFTKTSDLGTFWQQGNICWKKMPESTAC